MNIEEMFSLHGKTALLSGASSGLGAYFSTVLADAGAHVFLTARRTEKLAEVVDKIESNGGKAEAIRMDVSDPDSVYAAFAQLDQKISRLDILVNNAGISNSPVKFIEQNESDWENLLSNC